MGDSEPAPTAAGDGTVRKRKAITTCQPLAHTEGNPEEREWTDGKCDIPRRPKKGEKHTNLVKMHPIVKKSMCTSCWRFYHDTSKADWTKDPSGNLHFCILCGEGGQLYLCDVCDLSFHSNCVRSVFGQEEEAKMLKEGEYACPFSVWSRMQGERSSLNPIIRNDWMANLPQVVSHEYHVGRDGLQCKVHLAGEQEAKRRKTDAADAQPAVPRPAATPLSHADVPRIKTKEYKGRAGWQY